MTYTEHAQRLLDQASSPSLDRITSQPAIMSGSVAAKPTPFSANLGPFNPVASHDVQEARSLHLSNELVSLLKLTSGRWAVFNRAHELQAIVEAHPILDNLQRLNTPPTVPAVPTRHRKGTTLEDLGL